MTPAGGRLWLLPVTLLVLWLVLRLVPYSGRASLYAATATALDNFRHPLWGAVLTLAIVFSVLGARRGSVAGRLRHPALTPDVYVREEGPDRLMVVVSASRGAAARDFVVDRRREEETRILGRMRDLAARSVAFEATAAPRGDGADRRSLLEETRRELHALGLSLGDAVLGSDEALRRLLLDLPGDHLLLRIQPGLAHLPWELIVARAGSQFLWQQYHVARQVREDAEALAPRGAGTAPLRVLLLADLESDVGARALPAAEAEAAEIMELAARHPGGLRVVRRTPRSGEELATLLAEAYDVVHFAGHGGQTGAAWGWAVRGGDVVDPAGVIGASGTPPLLVFANACTSGPGAGTGPWSADAAARLLRSGVAAYVGTVWELDDRGSADFARVFYRAVLSGSTMGEAVTAARSALLGLSPFTWANYVLYGDPALALIPKPREE